MRKAIVILISLYFGYCVLHDLYGARVAVEEGNIPEIALLCTRAVVTALATVVVWIADLGFTLEGFAGDKSEEQSNVLGQGS